MKGVRVILECEECGHATLVPELEQARSQLAAAREEAEKASHWFERARYWHDRADRLEAALARLVNATDTVANPTASQKDPLALRDARTLIEHGPDDGLSGTTEQVSPAAQQADAEGGPAEPDDGKPVRVHGWATDATHGTEVTIEPDDGLSEGTDSELRRRRARASANPPSGPLAEPDDGESEQK